MPLVVTPLNERLPIGFGIAAVIVCLSFAAFTGHIWEDYFITFRASLNLANGNGLVFQAGERVHSFTSPLGTLLPALFAVGGGENVAIHALWSLRVVSALALGGALWMVVQRFQRDGLAGVALGIAGVALVIDPKIVDFAMNGMETGFVVFFVVFTWRSFASGARLWPCALGFGGLQWTRPDGCVYFAAIAMGWIVFGAAEFSWRARVRFLARVILLGGALYVPWFVFAWSYYGSPVPHTILAKSQHLSLAETVDRLGLYPWRLLFGGNAIHDVFKPAYHAFGGWPVTVHAWSRLLATSVAIVWVWPRVAPPGRMASAAFFLGGFYISYIPQAPWYYPGWQSMGWVALAYALHAVWHIRLNRPQLSDLPRASVRVGAALTLLLQAGLFLCVAWQMRAQQRIVENGIRREVGLWLGEVAKPEDTVFLECLGYIGYFSGLKMLDCPGLASPEVVATRRAGHLSFAQIIPVLMPNWLVLRPWEADMVYTDAPQLAQSYELARVFDNRPKVDALSIIPGRGYLNYDSTFFVFRRMASKPTP